MFIFIFLCLVILYAISVVKLTERMRKLERTILFTTRHQNYLIYKVLDKLTPVDAVRVEFFTIIDGEKRKVSKMFLKVTQKLPLFVAFTDSKGNVASVDGMPSWAVSDEALATLEVGADGLSAVVVPVGALGSFKVQVKADADLGEGVKEIIGEMDIDLMGGEAVAVNISAGAPVDV
jgi:hypothetical protein